MGEDNGKIIATNEISLPATKGQKRKLLLIPASGVPANPFEEERKEGLVLEAGRKVLHTSIVQEELGEGINMSFLNSNKNVISAETIQ